MTHSALLAALVSLPLLQSPAPSPAAAPAAAPAALSASPALATRTYRVRQTTRLDQIPSGAKLVRWWVSIPDDERLQDVLDFKVVSAPADWRVEREAEHGNRFLYLEAPRPASDAAEVVVEFTLRRRPLQVEIDPAKVGPISNHHRIAFADSVRRDAPHMEVTPEIEAMARKAIGGEAGPAVQMRKLLEFVASYADHYSKDKTKPTCGIGDAGDCMANLGGCCTDLHSLYVAMARSVGLPTRMQFGYRLLAKNEGKEVDPGYRCWVESFLPGYGWVPADIVEADAEGGDKELWFNGLSERRLWLNEGREFVLNPEQSGPRVNTMIMGYAEIDGVPARVLPEGELLPQLTRKVHFTEVSGAAAL